jgi:hypothetical protein
LLKLELEHIWIILEMLTLEHVPNIQVGLTIVG